MIERDTELVNKNIWGSDVRLNCAESENVSPKSIGTDRYICWSVVCRCVSRSVSSLLLFFSLSSTYRFVSLRQEHCILAQNSIPFSLPSILFAHYIQQLTHISPQNVYYLYCERNKDISSKILSKLRLFEHFANLRFVISQLLFQYLRTRLEIFDLGFAFTDLFAEFCFHFT